ncbi:MAG TPA: ATP-grasp domain-containing protein [Bryobacteraceae bacterium]|nr:ATP-grasp domain-containing protein [Bryobacteraceae bacterium]
MPRILLIAATTGYQTRSFAAAARARGIDVILATDRCHVLEDPWGDRAIAIRFEEPDKAASILSDIAVDGIVAVADRPTLIAALTAQKLGIPFHPPAAVAACRDKHRMRELFAAAGLAVPRNFRVALDSDLGESPARAGYPCVLKPLGLSASRGVIRANNSAEFIAAFERIRRILEQPEIRQFHDELDRAIQFEEYIEGREFALEGLMTGGELNVLAIFDKPDPLEGPFFEETIYVTPSREAADVQRAIVETTRAAVRGIGLFHGPIHAEMRVKGAQIHMLEVAARPIGGLCARALRFDGGMNLEELVMLHAIGKMPESLALSPPASGVMMIPVPGAGIFESVSGIEAARSVAGVDDIVVTAKQGQKLVPLPEGASYVGFIFATARDAASVEDSLRRAHAKLKFEILASLDVVPVTSPDML